MHSFLKKRLRLINYKTEVKKILTSEFKSLAKRQLNSRLDCVNTEQVFEIKNLSINIELWLNNL